jgi:hypothetical protein
MKLKRSEHPFRFVTQVSLVELTGLKARDLNELLQHLREAPGSIFYYHTHHFLKQHQFLSPEPPNDFAYWASNVLKEERLGEQLAAIDTVRYPSIRALAAKIIDVIEKYVAGAKTTRIAPEGEELHLMKSQSFLLPTPFVARDLAEFAEAVKKVSLHSLYHHIFQARMRLERESNDFSMWLETELEEKELARAITRLDPYTQTLDGLRWKIVYLAEERLRRVESLAYAS